MQSNHKVMKYLTSESCMKPSMRMLKPNVCGAAT